MDVATYEFLFKIASNFGVPVAIMAVLMGAAGFAIYKIAHWIAPRVDNVIDEHKAHLKLQRRQMRRHGVVLQKQHATLALQTNMLQQHGEKLDVLVVLGKAQLSSVKGTDSFEVPAPVESRIQNIVQQQKD